MKSISQTTQQMESISKKTSAFFRRYHVGQILRAANACKLKGFSSILVFLVLVSIIFENRSLYMQRRLHEDLILSILVDTLNSYKEDSYAAIGRAA